MTRQPLYRLLLLALLGPLLAAPATADDDREQYRVEIIIFKQSGDDTERWPTRPAPALHERYAELRGDAETPDADVFRLLDNGDRQLSAVARRLGESSHYDVLAHAAWIQPGLDRQEAAAVAFPLGTEMPGMDDGELRAEVNGNDEEEETASRDNGDRAGDVALPARPPEGLSGWVRIARERYLHVHLDLRWVDPDRGDAGPLDRLHGVFIEDMEPVVVMRDQRRMRSGELHYIDHPVLGLVVRVNRVND